MRAATFPSESALVDCLKDAMSEVVDRASPHVMTVEFPLGRRSVDIAYAEFPCLDGLTDADFAISLSNLSGSEMLVLARFASGRRVNRHLLLQHFWIDWQTLKERFLDGLVGAGLLRQYGEATFEPTEWVSFLPTRVMTVEAKLTDWRDALQQASYNRAYTSDSYVAFPASETARIEQSLHAFRAARVGVALVDPGDGVSVRLLARGGGSMRGIKPHFARLRVLCDLCADTGRWAVVPATVRGRK